MKKRPTEIFRNFKFEYKITLNYLVFGFLWILFSDKVLDMLVPDDSQLTELQTLKGSFFIIVTSFFLYLLVKRHMLKLRIAENKRFESEFRFARLWENGPFGLVVVSKEFLFENVNPEFCKILGYSKEELLQFTFKDISHSDDLAQDLPNIRKLINKEISVYKTEKRYIRKDGQVIWGALTVFPNFDNEGNFLYNLGIVEDITRRKEVTNELIKAKEKAEEGDKLKTAFLNNISHEVRTPLNGIVGFSELVIQPDLRQEEKELYLKILNECTERLVNTITNYMDISLIAAAGISVRSEPVDLSLILETVYQKYQAECLSKNLELIKQIPSEKKAHLLTDAALLEKALRHLLDNAIKFTGKGRITLGVTYTNNEVELFVRDTGAGIDPEAQSTVFQIFMQADAAVTRGHEGSGLGLSIAKGLVELLGGRISMESELGKGSSFYMTFPYINGIGLEIKSPGKSDERRNTSKSSLILIAEDDGSNSTFLITILKKASFNYLLAPNGREAVELCLTHPEISLVLMDLKMPVMDGFSATRKIKELRKDLPVIGVTALAMTGDKEKALDAGIDEYLSKPVKPDVLLSVIKKHLGIQLLNN